MKRKEQDISSNVSPDMAMENMMSDTKAEIMTKIASKQRM